MASILITGASLAKAYRLKNTLPAADVILGDYLDLPDVMIKSGQMIKLPNPQAESYPHQMLALCLDNGFDTVYVLHADEMRALAPSTQLFNEYGITFKTIHDQV
jgi:hypothetical protein